MISESLKKLEEISKFLESNENEITTYQNFGDMEMAVQSGSMSTYIKK
jgi:hypothetical protein